MRVVIVGLLLCWVLGAPSPAAETRALTADGIRRTALDSLEFPSGVEHLALSPDGSRAAVSTGDAVQIVALDDRSAAFAAPIDVGGVIRALAWSGYDESTLWVLRHRPAKRRAGDTDLLEIDLERARPLRRLRLPDDAATLTWWPIENALLVGSGPTLRSIRLDGMVSGPMFRLSDPLRATASLGGSRLLVSTTDGLALVDLGDAPGPDSMPYRATLETGTSLRALTPSADAMSALGVNDSGALLRISIEPLSATSLDDHGIVAVGVPRREIGLRPSREARGRIREADAEMVAQAQEPVEAEPVDEPLDEPVIQPAIVPEVEPLGEPTPLPTDAQLGGVILGPALGDVAAVVLHGPDSMLREAARVAPAADGRWSAAGLAPGRYRIQLSGEGGAVILSEPPYAVVRVEADVEPIVVPPMRALRRL